MLAEGVTKTLIAVADAPDVPGLSFRHFRGEVDYPEMYRVLMACNSVDGEERSTTVEDLALDYSHLTNCNPYQDMIFPEINGEVIGYGRCTWWQEEAPPRTRIHTGFGWVIPEWRRRGIARAMLRYQESHLRHIAAEHDDGTPCAFEANVVDTQVAKRALIESEGYRPVTYAGTMVRPDLENIPDLPLPDGLRVYPVKEEHLRTIWEADIEAFRDHWGYSPPVDREAAFQSFIAFRDWEDLSLWRIAWDGDPDHGGVVAGQVKGFINPTENELYGRKRGWTEGISTTRAYRRQGVARALIAMSLKAVKERGMEEAALGVHVENPNGAFNLYESMGFRMAKMVVIYRKPMG
jgi:ribosomal protein S18 acetylase RimI-like enzyme